MITFYFHEHTVCTHIGFSCRNLRGQTKMKDSAFWEWAGAVQGPLWRPRERLAVFSAGRWQPAGRLSAGQLWRRPGPDHGRLSERPAQGTDWRGGDFQR